MKNDENEDDEFDIYSNLPNFNYDESIQKLESKNKLLYEKMCLLEGKVTTLNNELQICKRDKEVLAKNISSLYLSSKQEINRKNKLIEKLTARNEELEQRWRRNRGRNFIEEQANKTPDINYTNEDKHSNRNILGDKLTENDSKIRTASKQHSSENDSKSRIFSKHRYETRSTKREKDVRNEEKTKQNNDKEVLDSRKKTEIKTIVVKKELDFNSKESYKKPKLSRIMEKSSNKKDEKNMNEAITNVNVEKLENIDDKKSTIDKDNSDNLDVSHCVAYKNSPQINNTCEDDTVKDESHVFSSVPPFSGPRTTYSIRRYKQMYGVSPFKTNSPNVEKADVGTSDLSKVHNKLFDDLKDTASISSDTGSVEEKLPTILSSLNIIKKTIMASKKINQSDKPMNEDNNVVIDTIKTTENAAEETKKVNSDIYFSKRAQFTELFGESPSKLDASLSYDENNFNFFKSINLQAKNQDTKENILLSLSQENVESNKTKLDSDKNEKCKSIIPDIKKNYLDFKGAFQTSKPIDLKQTNERLTNRKDSADKENPQQNDMCIKPSSTIKNILCVINSSNISPNNKSNDVILNNDSAKENTKDSMNTLSSDLFNKDNDRKIESTEKENPTIFENTILNSGDESALNMIKSLKVVGEFISPLKTTLTVDSITAKQFQNFQNDSELNKDNSASLDVSNKDIHISDLNKTDINNFEIITLLEKNKIKENETKNTFKTKLNKDDVNKTKKSYNKQSYSKSSPKHKESIKTDKLTPTKQSLNSKLNEPGKNMKYSKDVTNKSINSISKSRLKTNICERRSPSEYFNRQHLSRIIQESRNIKKPVTSSMSSRVLRRKKLLEERKSRMKLRSSSVKRHISKKNLPEQQNIGNRKFECKPQSITCFPIKRLSESPNVKIVKPIEIKPQVVNYMNWKIIPIETSSIKTSLIRRFIVSKALPEFEKLTKKELIPPGLIEVAHASTPKPIIIRKRTLLRKRHLEDSVGFSTIVSPTKEENKKIQNEITTSKISDDSILKHSILQTSRCVVKTQLNFNSPSSGSKNVSVVSNREESFVQEELPSFKRHCRTLK